MNIDKLTIGKNDQNKEYFLLAMLGLNALDFKKFQGCCLSSTHIIIEAETESKAYPFPQKWKKALEGLASNDEDFKLTGEAKELFDLFNCDRLCMNGIPQDRILAASNAKRVKYSCEIHGEHESFMLIRDLEGDYQRFCALCLVQHLRPMTKNGHDKH